MSWRGLSAGLNATVRDDGPLRERIVGLLRQRYGARDALLVDSGTAALLLAIRGALGEGEGCVALPGYTCYDMSTAAEGAGASVALYDLDPVTLAPGPDAISELIDLRPHAVVLGHLFGHLVDVPAIASALPEDMIVIEDAAQGIGGRIGSRLLGSFGSVAVLSFGRGKGMTGGGGGALLAHDERGAEIVDRARRSLLPAGRRGVKSLVALAGQLALGRPSLYGIPAALPFLRLGETIYHPPWEPRAATRATLAVLEAGIRPADEAVEVRTANAGRLLEALERSGRLAAPVGVPGAAPGYLRLPAVASPAAGEAPVDARAKRLGIERGYPTTLAALPSLRPRLVRPPDLPGASLLANRLVTLPTHGLLTEADLEAVERWIAGRDT